MKAIENGEWAGLSTGSKNIIRDKVAKAAKIQGAKLFTGPTAKADMRAAAQRFEDALRKNRPTTK
jgi:hypothetical protein